MDKGRRIQGVEKLLSRVSSVESAGAKARVGLDHGGSVREENAGSKNSKRSKKKFSPLAPFHIINQSGESEEVKLYICRKERNEMVWRQYFLCLNTYYNIILCALCETAKYQVEEENSLGA